jgi:hypothetical protein
MRKYLSFPLQVDFSIDAGRVDTWLSHARMVLGPQVSQWDQQ